MSISLFLLANHSWKDCEIATFMLSVGKKGDTLKLFLLVGAPTVV